MGIRLENVPISRAADKFAKRYDYSANDLALYGGEEYHLVLAVTPGKFEAATHMARGELIRIGIVTRQFRGVRLTQAQNEVAIAMKGWEHFKS